VLGLLAEPESLAALLIGAKGISLEAVRDAATAALPSPVSSSPEVVPYDEESRKTLELTFREALRLGHNYIGTEHLLLALLEIENGAGPLSDLGLEKRALEADLLALLDQLPSAPTKASSDPAPGGGTPSAG
jgi:ATP-dependent Clp protease ATP-binding subunit ClpA